jgi:hypothetical protein
MRRPLLAALAALAALCLAPAAASAAIDTQIVFEGKGSGEVFGDPGAEGGIPHLECHWDGDLQTIDAGTPEAGKCETEAQEALPGIKGIVVRQLADPGSEFAGFEILKGATAGCNPSGCSAIFPPIEIKAIFCKEGEALAQCAEPPPPSPPPGIKHASVAFTDKDGSVATRAGSHPFAMKVGFDVETLLREGSEFPVGSVKDLSVELPVGLVGDPGAVPTCPAAQFFTEDCPDASALGRSAVKFDFSPFPAGQDLFVHVPVFNLDPPPGVAQRIGFVVLSIPVTIDSTLSEEPPYRVVSEVTNIAQAALFVSQRLTLWGDPSDTEHDELRGSCLEPATLPAEEPGSLGECPPAKGEHPPLLTLPRSCAGPLQTGFDALWWAGLQPDGEGGSAFDPGATDSATAESEAMTYCPALLAGFAPEISARPTTDQASSPSGLDFSLHVKNPRLTNPGGRSVSDIKEVEVTLPEGVTINPSQAEGLKTCSEADLGRETLSSQFGDGCPAAAKIGAIEVETPLLKDEVLRGDLFVATPHANQADDSLIAFYIVIRDRELGILVKQPARVEPDPRTGQLVTTTEEMPQVPFSDFRLRFREGGRSPLVTPDGCGTYEVRARFTPWADPAVAYKTTSSFRISSGADGGPCPTGPAPFEPGFSAGAQSNQAGSFSPFLMRLTRRDGDQDLTRFDATLPPGVLARLTGVERCPEAAIAAARAKTGKAEQASPSCPAGSEIGTVQGGAGVGSQLTYVPGRLYLAGPVGDAPLSVAAIVPAVAGPFDVGTIVVRQALDLDPRTGVARVDGAASDPIPHILAGIPLRVRDIQVNIERPGFTLNPTSCAETSTLAEIWGGGENVFSRLDDSPVGRSARFQAAGCRGLGFSPRLGLKLRGGTRRGAFPALRAHYRPRPRAQANLSRLALAFPRSAFIEQGHFRTICTRVRFAADAGHGAQCPKGSVYGRVKVWTPLLAQPLTGPVYLRSSDHELPDAVLALRSPIGIRLEVAVRIDSIRGRLRAILADVPDAPVSRVIVQMQGGRKGLFVNSRNLCRKQGRNRARANGRAQNGRRSLSRPLVRALGCRKARGRR